MSDEFDGCECVWSHEFAMRRLLAFIRQNQNECSDTICLDARNNLPMSNMLGHPTVGTDDGGNYTMMTMLMVFALVLYFIRPQSVLSLRSKRRATDAGDRGDGPPPAPPAVN